MILHEPFLTLGTATLLATAGVITTTMGINGRLFSRFGRDALISAGVMTCGWALLLYGRALGVVSQEQGRYFLSFVALVFLMGATQALYFSYRERRL